MALPVERIKHKYVIYIYSVKGKLLLCTTIDFLPTTNVGESKGKSIMLFDKTGKKQAYYAFNKRIDYIDIYKL